MWLCRCSSVVEQLFRKQQVVGSRPTTGSKARESSKPALFLLPNIGHCGACMEACAGHILVTLVSRGAAHILAQPGRRHPREYLAHGGERDWDGKRGGAQVGRIGRHTISVVKAWYGSRRS